jgi:hypothetical protein
MKLADIINTPIGIRTHTPNIWVAIDSKCLTPFGQYSRRPLNFYMLILKVYIII